MRRRLYLLLLALGLVALSAGGLAPSQAQASCQQHCTLINCGFECCTFSDCTTHCFNVFCQG
jgi:hypothetical protein